MILETCRKRRSSESSPPYHGEMAEWSKAVDSKSIVRSCVPGVRIPLSPPFLFILRLLSQEEKSPLRNLYFKGVIKVLHVPD